jgi:hypothetical protein
MARLQQRRIGHCKNAMYVSSENPMVGANICSKAEGLLMNSQRRMTQPSRFRVSPPTRHHAIQYCVGDKLRRLGHHPHARFLLQAAPVTVQQRRLDMLATTFDWTIGMSSANYNPLAITAQFIP